MYLLRGIESLKPVVRNAIYIVGIMEYIIVVVGVFVGTLLLRFCANTALNKLNMLGGDMKCMDRDEVMKEESNSLLNRCQQQPSPRSIKAGASRSKNGRDLSQSGL